MRTVSLAETGVLLYCSPATLRTLLRTTDTDTLCAARDEARDRVMIKRENQLQQEIDRREDHDQPMRA